MRGKLEEKKMGVKKKLGLGLASAALGLSLVGGGTFAYFSDNATIHNSIASGTLKFEAKKVDNTSWPVNFDLANFRPGDSVSRTFQLDNTGSLAIESTYLKFVNATVKDAQGADSAFKDELLNTLRVTYFWQSHENDDWIPINIMVNSNTTLTLNEALNKQYAGKIKTEFLKGGDINLTPNGIDTGNFGRFSVRIQFPDNGQPQNNLQGLTAKFDFGLEARQVIGEKNHPQPWGPNGKITGNETQGLTNQTVDPNSGTNITNPVTKP
jgi:spore coat-associated protein N